MIKYATIYSIFLDTIIINLIIKLIAEPTNIL